MTSTFAQVLLAIADKGNDTAMTCLKQLLTRPEWYAREIAIVCIKKLSVACSCDIFDELGASCRCSIVQTLIELTQGDNETCLLTVATHAPGFCERVSLPALATLLTAGLCLHAVRLCERADPYWKVRTAAMTTLQVVASRRDKRVALACRARLKDGDFNVYGLFQKSSTG